jgi:hypothetical protein
MNTRQPLALFMKSNKGYYVSLETFISLDHPSKPTIFLQKEWGMDPFENEIWTHFDGIEKQVNNSIEEKQALLCWQKTRFLFSFLLFGGSFN